MSFGGVYRGKRVLVTGHTGFKGSWLALWLDTLGAKVHALALPPQGLTHFGLVDGAAYCSGAFADVRDAAVIMDTVASIRPEVVFHLAAQALVRESYVDPKGTFDTNVGGTVNVLESVRRVGGVQAVVVVTSDKCYENDERVAPYREGDPLGGHDPYSASKGAAEIVAHAYRRSFFARGAPALATARAGNVIGGGDFAKDRIVPDCVRSLTQGHTIQMRNPDSVRPWQHVLEPLSGYLWLGARLIEQPDLAGPYNFGPHESARVTVRQLAEAVIGAWGTGTIEEIRDPAAPREARYLRLDCSRAEEVLGWHSLLSGEETASYTVEWYRRWHHGADAAALRAFSQAQISAYTDRALGASLPWAKA